VDKLPRRHLARHMSDNPSLKATLPDSIADAYGNAIIGSAIHDEAPLNCSTKFYILDLRDGHGSGQR
jgi:hypothetical protein